MIAVGWIGLISVLFILPTVFPVTLGNFNYTIVAVGVVVVGTNIWAGFFRRGNGSRGRTSRARLRSWHRSKPSFVATPAPVPAVSAG